MNSWFDPKTGILLFDELLNERETFRKIMEDNYVSSEEIREQSNLVIEKLHNLESLLDESERAQVADVIAELAVLFAISQYSQLQEIKTIKEG